MLEKLNDALHEITPHIVDSMSGIIPKVGMTSAAVTVGTAATVKAMTTQDVFWLFISNMTILLTSISAMLWIVSIVYNMYLAKLKSERGKKELELAQRKDAREQEEHELKNGNKD